MPPIFLDNNSTTPLDPRVIEAMLQEMKGPPANPSSIHSFGRRAKKLLEEARRSIASFFETVPESVIFTSGGTEALNFLIRGLFYRKPLGHLITSTIEHPAVYKTIRSLEDLGAEVTYLKVDTRGAPTPESIESAIRLNTTAIVLSASNSETGVKLDIESASQIAQKHSIPFILDAVGYVGKDRLPHLGKTTAIAFSGHKFHAPQGIGVAIISPSLCLSPLLTGGGQEFSQRAGTENFPGIIGLKRAIEILQQEQDSITAYLCKLQSRFEEGLINRLCPVKINGEGPRLANTSNVQFLGVDAESLFIHLDQAGIAISHGSACASGAREPSRVLLEMGLSRKAAMSSLRFSFSRMNTLEEIDRCIEILHEAVQNLRKYL